MSRKKEPHTDLIVEALALWRKRRRQRRRHEWKISARLDRHKEQYGKFLHKEMEKIVRQEIAGCKVSGGWKLDPTQFSYTIRARYGITLTFKVGELHIESTFEPKTITSMRRKVRHVMNIMAAMRGVKHRYRRRRAPKVDPIAQRKRRFNAQYQADIRALQAASSTQSTDHHERLIKIERQIVRKARKMGLHCNYDLSAKGYVAYVDKPTRMPDGYLIIGIRKVVKTENELAAVGEAAKQLNTLKAKVEKQRGNR